MKHNNTLLPRTLTLAVLLALTGAATAQSAGSFSVRLGVTQITPDVTSGDLTAPSFPGTKADVKAASQLVSGVTYMLTDNWAVDVPLIVQPFKHEMVGDGAIAGVGKIGEVKAWPATVVLQYRFGAANAPMRFHVGAGGTYAKFTKARSSAALSALTGGTPTKPTTLEVKSKFAPTLEVGGTFEVSKAMFFTACLDKSFLKTTATLSSGQTLDTKLDPLAITLAVGWRF